MSETAELPEHRLKRLHMRSMRRGIKEMDLILPPFAAARLPRMDDAELALYEDLLNESDHDLYQWVSSQAAPPDRYADMIGQIREQLAGGVR
ncbi:succinate dehydrogenase assembly factor 2 [Sulfitobacter alexandrii]|uniref:FAD assembly factor SdhE n=1 Tax=Sulfitobacter alexandrii TaxID=1917485 RepID=A0A1J0WF15_9RHOB|nr:succinate dehydrogenase assembly factor 2 [Sulfitobacter alexandrii]APE42911.1 succinate dehydrogenase assembly factor 2 [Sulfitobacter alexandrii]